MNKSPVMAGAIGIGIIALVMAFKPKDAPVKDTFVEVPFVPMDLISQEDISTASDMDTLDAYYNRINQLYLAHHISFEQYLALYDAYERRFYELWGTV